MAKRTLDVTISVLGLVLLCPALGAIALIIKWTSPGPVFYVSDRVGKYGTFFRLYKFRTMVMDAHKLGPAVTGAQDRRITPVGRWLRRAKLDELPQLINVLKGDMSLVGPRPEDPRYVQFYTAEQRRVLDLRPGITSPASIAYRHEETILTGDNWEKYYVQTIMPAKLELDLDYARHPSVTQDMRIIWQTFRALFQ
jgi:lipopolysaccharide/colanic/teichoic acid biosynthesis glycosyltransferase